MYYPNKIEDSFEMCRSYCDTFKIIQKRDTALALTFINAIIDYGLDRKKPDENDPIWMNGLAAIFSQIDGSFQKELATFSKNKDKDKKKAEDKKLNKMNKLDLERIASLASQKYTQQEIGEKLGISQQIVSYRLGVIRSEYPELLSNTNTKIENL